MNVCVGMKARKASSIAHTCKNFYGTRAALQLFEGRSPCCSIRELDQFFWLEFGSKAAYHNFGISTIVNLSIIKECIGSKWYHVQHMD